MPLLKVPGNQTNTIDAHSKWLDILYKAQELVQEDLKNQEAAFRGIRLKERRMPPEVVGRCYAQYCNVINQMYDAYLNSVHLQRARYILEIVALFLKRMYELRNELVHIIVNDYIYVDSALAQLRMTPYDIQIVVPYHYPLECRKDSVEKALQKMWADAIRRKNKVPKKVKEVKPEPPGLFDEEEILLPPAEEPVAEDSSEEAESIKPSVHTIIPEQLIQANIIQKHERFRQWYLQDYRAKCTKRKLYSVGKGQEAPMTLRVEAAKLIQKVYSALKQCFREFMKRKRQKINDDKRDTILGLLPDTSSRPLKFYDENCKVYELRRDTRLKLEQVYLKDFEQENTRLILFKKENQIDDITEHIREWFKEWYYGYGFFPEFPYEIEGGTLLVIRGDYPSIEEKVEEDEKILAATKGKTKEQLKQEKEQKAADDKLKAEAEKERKKKEDEQLFKMRCNPEADPGYRVHESNLMDEMIEALQRYRTNWCLYENYPPERYGETIYGYLKPMLTEELMCQMHQDCRIYVDELMRLDLKLLIKQHQLMYKRLGWKYPKIKPRKMPKAPVQPKQFNVDDNVLKKLERVFDLGIITKPKTKISDIYGDLNYAAYDLNVQDPNAKFPNPGYGDIRRRLVLSCVFGTGIQPGATKKRAVMLLGPERNGKSFLVDAVAGEMGAIKIDISPECFSSVVNRPAKLLSQVFIAAKTFQPAVIYCENIERVFYMKVPPQEKRLKANKIKSVLGKLIKQISPDDKVIFIGTCSNPFAAKRQPLVSIFDEIILVPRTDYGTLQRFFVEKLQWLNITPLSPMEFLEVMIEREYEPVTTEEFQEYVNFYLANSPLKTERAQYEIINATRATVYEKLAKKGAQEKP